MKKILNYSYIILFGALISIISVSTLLHYGRTDAEVFRKIEKRDPAEMPEWSLKSVLEDRYFNAIDSYINDIFAFRTGMIETYSAILYIIGSSANLEKVVIGKNDYLFLGNAFQHIIDHTEGKTLFSDEELKRWLLKFTQTKQYLDLKNILFYVVVVPSKHVMYPEFLPTYISPAQHTNINQIINSNPNFNLIYLKDTLNTAKKEWKRFLYNKTDSHWSEIGAYISYLKIIDFLKPDFEKLEPIELNFSDFTIKPHPGWQNKHLLQLPLDLNDFNVDIIWNDKWDTTLVKTDYEGHKLPFRYNQEIEYHEKVVVYNEDKPYTLLLLEDSFSIRLSPYLNQTFGKIIYCHYNEPEAIELTQLIEKYQPNLVLSELGEQSLLDNGNTHPNIIAEITNNKYNIVKSWNCEELYHEISKYNQIIDVHLKNGDIHFTATGTDPSFQFPVFEFSQDKPKKINIEFTSPGRTIAQIFFKKAENERYSGKNSETVRVEEGRNKLSFHLPINILPSTPIRFDPGTIQGRYVIHSVEFCEYKE